MRQITEDFEMCWAPLFKQTHGNMESICPVDEEYT